MTNKPKLGFLVRVHAPGLDAQYYATIAESVEAAMVAVGDYLKLTNQSVEFQSVLTEGQMRLIDLKLGEVKLYV